VRWPLIPTAASLAARSSPELAESHLRQAFRKLSIASRVELTRIVIEQAGNGPGGLATLTM
jgi:hypothetical protein